MGTGFVRSALREAGRHVEVHADHFAEDAPDVQWLPIVGERNWLLITKDSAIKRNTLERNALLLAGVRSFVLTPANITGADQAAIFVKHLNRMENLAHSRTAPFIARVTRSEVTIFVSGSPR